MERARAADEKERKRLYLEFRAAEVEQMNAELVETISCLKSLLADGLVEISSLDFEQFKVKPPTRTLDLGAHAHPRPQPQYAQFAPKKPWALVGWIPNVRRRHEEACSRAIDAHQKALEEHELTERHRTAEVLRLKDEHQQLIKADQSEADRRNKEVEDWRQKFLNGEREAVQDYCQEVLESSAYPEEFTKEVKIAYVPESRQLVLEYDFPTLTDLLIPETKSITYVKANDEFKKSTRPEKERRALYASVIAQVTLRCLHELFTAGTEHAIDSVVFNGYVDTIHPGTGQGIRPCLVTVRTTREQFLSINLQKADPAAALATLQASFSKSPAELAPVRPILEFSMVDPRFIAEVDVISTLDQRPNLMDLSPGEFENLITNLFQKMGLEAKLTQASRDGGVDCVAYDPRPIFGGKVVIQAKRYKNTVGVSAVRDLFGTMQNEGASKGILVTTSGYGKAAFDFAAGKPMELLDGGHLLYLLKEHAGLDARIVMPEDWKDPVADAGV